MDDKGVLGALKQTYATTMTKELEDKEAKRCMVTTTVKVILIYYSDVLDIVSKGSMHILYRNIILSDYRIFDIIWGV